jgi:hypothetical protein
MIPEPLKGLIPDWLIVLDHQRLSQRNPDVVHDQIATSEVLKQEILGVRQRCRMLAEPLVQDRLRCRRQQASYARPSPTRNRATHIDGNLAGFRHRRSDRRVRQKVAQVVEGVKPRARKHYGRWQG